MFSVSCEHNILFTHLFFFEHIILITSFLLCSFYYEGIKTTFRISSGQIDIFMCTFVLHCVQKLLGMFLISVLFSTCVLIMIESMMP